MYIRTAHEKKIPHWNIPLIAFNSDAETCFGQIGSLKIKATLQSLG